MFFSGGYVFLAFVAAAVSYIIAHRKGLNAAGWSWASLFLIFPVLILPFVQSRRRETSADANIDGRWNSLVSYDPDIKGAVEQLRPLGQPAVDEFRRVYCNVQDKNAIPSIVADLEQKWAAHSAIGLTKIETKDGVDIMRDPASVYHVAGRQTADLKTARAMAVAAARRARDMG